MGTYLVRRAVHSFFSLAGLLVLVFFLARLTGDPDGETLLVPWDATLGTPPVANQVAGDVDASLWHAAHRCEARVPARMPSSGVMPVLIIR